MLNEQLKNLQLKAAAHEDQVTELEEQVSKSSRVSRDKGSIISDNDQITNLEEMREHLKHAR